MIDHDGRDSIDPAKLRHSSSRIPERGRVERGKTKIASATAPARRRAPASRIDVVRIRDEIAHAYWERLISVTRHAPSMSVSYESSRIDFLIGCVCGWKIPDGSQNPDDDVAWHVTIARVVAADADARRPII